MAENISFSYRSGFAIKGVSLRFEQGVHALLGRNGAGKSTLMRLLIGSLRPDGGSLHSVSEGDPLPLTPAELRRRVGYVPQSPNWPAQFTVRDFLAYFSIIRCGRSGHDLRVSKSLARLDLESLADQRLGQLSGGQRQRAFIAQALVHDPPVLVLDEPFSGLDPEQRASLREVLRAVERSKSVLVSTHVVGDVAAMSRRILILDNGRLVWQGSAADLAAEGGVHAPGDSDGGWERGFVRVISGEVTSWPQRPW